MAYNGVGYIYIYTIVYVYYLQHHFHLLWVVQVHTASQSTQTNILPMCIVCGSEYQFPNWYHHFSVFHFKHCTKQIHLLILMFPYTSPPLHAKLIHFPRSKIIPLVSSSEMPLAWNNLSVSVHLFHSLSLPLVTLNILLYIFFTNLSFSMDFPRPYHPNRFSFMDLTNSSHHIFSTFRLYFLNSNYTT